jgi:hypothetical protein
MIGMKRTDAGYARVRERFACSVLSRAPGVVLVAMQASAEKAAVMRFR